MEEIIRSKDGELNERHSESALHGEVVRLKRELQTKNSEYDAEVKRHIEETQESTAELRQLMEALDETETRLGTEVQRKAAESAKLKEEMSIQYWE